MAAPITSQAGLVNGSPLTISSPMLGSDPSFAVTFPNANQFGIIDSCHYFSLPANHGGLRLNYLVPSRTDGLGVNPWGSVNIRQDWTVEDIDGPECWRVPATRVNDPFHSDAAVILAPGVLARNLRVRASVMFKSGAAAGSVVNFQAALAGAGASVIVVALSHVEYRLY